MKKSEILDYCSMPPRKVQTQILTTIEQDWDNYDIFVVLAPVAAGKSLIAATLAKWNKGKYNNGTSIMTPDNVLVKQYLDTFDLESIKVKQAYKNVAAYNIAKYKLKGSTCVLNYYSYLANRAYNNLLIVDEAHQLIDHLRSTTKLWKHLYNMPDNLYTSDDLMEWLSKPHKLPVGRQVKLEQVKNLLAGAPDRYIIEVGVELYRGQPKEVLKIIDLIPRDNPPIYWPPGRVKKMVMMSATFSKEDIYDLGLDKYRVKVIDVPSPIPKENRPIIYRPVANMSYANLSTGVYDIAEWCIKMNKMYPSERGLVHTTYSVANKLRKAIGDNPNFIFHTRWDKEAKLDRWLNTPGAVFIGCGITTGLSLDEDKCRWQAIANLPFPNVKDRAVMANLKRRPKNYYWQTIRHVLQASGRVCRTPTDRGDTFLLDSRFRKLYNEHKDLFPEWFREALHGV